MDATPLVSIKLSEAAKFIADDAQDGHICILGDTGSGKTRLALLLYRQAIASGRVVGYIGTHGVGGGQSTNLPLTAETPHLVSLPGIGVDREGKLREALGLVTEFETVASANDEKLTLIIDEHLFWGKEVLRKAVAFSKLTGTQLIAVGQQYPDPLDQVSFAKVVAFRVSPRESAGLFDGLLDTSSLRAGEFGMVDLSGNAKRALISDWAG